MIDRIYRPASQFELSRMVKISSKYLAQVPMADYLNYNSINEKAKIEVSPIKQPWFLLFWIGSGHLLNGHLLHISCRILSGLYVHCMNIFSSKNQVRTDSGCGMSQENTVAA